MNTIIYILLFFPALIGGLIVFLFKTDNKKLLKLLLALSGSYLLSICVLHLIPEIYSSNVHSTGIYILIGFFLQIFLEFFSKGIEHGHAHSHQEQKGAFPLTIIISLCIHSFVEGMPLAERFYLSNQYLSKSLLIGIILHKIPVAIVLMSMLLHSNVKKYIALIWLIIFALMAPIGTFISNILSENVADIADYFNIIMAIIVGVFLHVSTTILFESSEKHSFHLIKFAAVFIGVGLALISM